LAVVAYKFFMGLHRVTWVHSSMCPINQVDAVSALPALIACIRAIIQNINYWPQNI